MKGEPWKIFFICYWGVKNCLRKGDCVLEGQPMGIPPLPPPLANLCSHMLAYGCVWDTSPPRKKNVFLFS